MDKITFTINTSADILAAWLHTNWRAPVSATERETLHGLPLVSIHHGGGVRVLTADVIRVVEEANMESHQVGRDSFRFFLQPLHAHRVEVTVEGRFWLALLEALVSLLETMAMPGRWPELRHSLDYSLDGWYPFDEGARAALDAFEARLGRLKAGPAVTLAPARSVGVGGGESTTPASETARDDGQVVKPRRKGRSLLVRQERIRRLFEEENLRDLTIAQMARTYGVHRKTISRDLKDLGYILENGILKRLPP